MEPTMKVTSLKSERHNPQNASSPNKKTTPNNQFSLFAENPPERSDFFWASFGHDLWLHLM
jgi:hypothetical protein